MRTLLAMGIGLLILLVGCSVQAEPTTVHPPQTIYVIEGDEAVEITPIQKPRTPLVFEIEHELTDEEWIKATADKRKRLNQLYIDQRDAREEQERQDRIKSQNWQTRVDGRLVSGYDVIRDQKGEFDDYPRAAKSERFLYHIEEFE